MVDVPARQPPVAPSLTHQTARGFVWVTIDTVLTKVVGVLAQMALARLLLPEDWGLVGLAFTVATFAELVAAAGFREVLMQRSRGFHLWANAAVWLSLVFGIAASLVMVALAPLASVFYKSPDLPGLVYYLALGSPFLSLAIVPEARLRSQMRFRAVSALNSGRNVGITLATIVLAALGFGAYSFVAARPVFAAAYATAMWWLARPPVQLNPQIRRWRFLLADSTVVLLGSVVLISIGQAGFIVLGRVCSEDVVGYYYFAYNLSLQSAVLLGLNLAGVLFPALAALQHDSARQLSAFVRASRMLAAIGIPACAAQAAVAQPLIAIFFGERMLPAVGVFAVLSLGMGYHVMWNPSRSLLQSNRRFRLSLMLLTAYAAIFIPSVVLGAALGEALGVAIATAVVFTLVAPFDTWMAVRTIGGGWREVRSIFVGPTVLSAIAFGPPALAATRLPATAWSQWIGLLAVPMIGLVLYAALLHWQSPQMAHDIRHRLRGIRSSLVHPRR